MLQILPPILLEFAKRQIPLVTNRELARSLPTLVSPRDAQRFIGFDTWHPSREAHEQLAGFVLNLMGYAARSVHPESCQAQADAPIVTHEASSQCTFGDLLLAAFVPSRSRGWEHISERGKPGLVANRVGSELSLAIMGMQREQLLLQVRSKRGWVSKDATAQRFRSAW